ncbi:MAG TPA: hypothetical protein VM553_10355 [Dongiaceae bacterium]|nr:hypothetical protein [Dongiaceae bacterium]
MELELGLPAPYAASKGLPFYLGFLASNVQLSSNFVKEAPNKRTHFSMPIQWRPVEWLLKPPLNRKSPLLDQTKGITPMTELIANFNAANYFHRHLPAHSI